MQNKGPYYHIICSELGGENFYNFNQGRRTKKFENHTDLGISQYKEQQNNSL